MRRDSCDLKIFCSGIGEKRGFPFLSADALHVCAGASINPRDAVEVPTGLQVQAHVIQGGGCDVNDSRCVAVIKGDEGFRLLPIGTLHRSDKSCACTVANLHSRSFSQCPMSLQGRPVGVSGSQGTAMPIQKGFFREQSVPKPDLGDGS